MISDSSRYSGSGKVDHQHGGSPVTIPTAHKHAHRKSQTSLLIEYFEASKTADKARSRPSVTVKVTSPSTSSKKRAGNTSTSDAIQITRIGKDRKVSDTRRISLGTPSASRTVELVPAA